MTLTRVIDWSHAATATQTSQWHRIEKVVFH